MVQDKTRIKQIQEYYNLSCNYLESSNINLENELIEPTMFSAIHALELSLKTALLTKTDEAQKKYNIDEQFGKYFQQDMGDKICRRFNYWGYKFSINPFLYLPFLEKQIFWT